MDPRKQAETNEAERSGNKSYRGGRIQGIFYALAKFFNGFHWAIGMTALPETASPREVRSFVFMWLGIIAFMIFFFAIMIRVLA